MSTYHRPDSHQHSASDKTEGPPPPHLQPSKIGAGHLAAMGRLGLKELSQAMVALPDSNIRPVEEPGLYGNLTPQEVVASKGSYEAALAKYSTQKSANLQQSSLQPPQLLQNEEIER